MFIIHRLYYLYVTTRMRGNSVFALYHFFKFDFCVFLMKAGETAETLSHQTIMLIKR